MIRRLLVPTLVETAGMVVWLGLAAAGRGLLGLAGLQVALTAEHAILKSVLRRKPGAYLRDVPLAATVSLIETVLWGIGLFLWRTVHPVVGYVFLVLAINVEHTIQDNYFEDRPLFSKLFDPSLLPATVLEVSGFAAAQGLVDEFGPVLGAVLGAPVFLFFNALEHRAIARKVDSDAP